MKPPISFDRHVLDHELEAWMEEGPDVLPDMALEEALARVDVTRQRPMALVSDRLLRTSAGGPMLGGWGSVAVAAAAILLAVTLFSVLGRPDVGADDEPTPLPSQSAVSSAPPRVEIQADAVIPVPGAMLTVAEGGQVWASSDEALVVIDPTTNDTRSLPVPVPDGSWSGLVFADGDLWIGNYHEGVLYRLDPETGDILAEVEVGPEAVSITAVPGAIWVRTQGGVTWEAQRIDTTTNEVVATVDGGNSIAYGHGSLWFGQRGADRIIRADPITGETIEVISVPRDAECSASVTSTAVWGSCFLDQPTGMVTRIDPATNEVVATIQLGGVPTGFFELDGRVWISTVSQGSGAVERIDLERNAVDLVLVIGPGFDPHPSAISGGSVWMANDGQGEIRRFPLELFAAP